MSERRRIVIDTNALVSRLLLPRSVPARPGRRRPSFRAAREAPVIGA
jgi:hypothetical protein